MKLNYTGNQPIQATEGAAGLDLILDFGDDITRYHVLEAGKRALYPTGTYVEIPEGYVGMICPRSGLAIKQGVSVLNAPGIIDSDYRGQISVILFNPSKRAVTLEQGERIAQLVITPAPAVELVKVDELTQTKRGAQGFGSTGSNELSRR